MEIKNEIIEGDCVDVLKTLPDGCADLAVTDPLTSPRSVVRVEC